MGGVGSSSCTFRGGQLSPENWDQKQEEFPTAFAIPENNVGRKSIEKHDEGKDRMCGRKCYRSQSHKRKGEVSLDPTNRSPQGAQKEKGSLKTNLRSRTTLPNDIDDDDYDDDDVSKARRDSAYGPYVVTPANAMRRDSLTVPQRRISHNKIESGRGSLRNAESSSLMNQAPQSGSVFGDHQSRAGIRNVSAPGAAAATAVTAGAGNGNRLKTNSCRRNAFGNFEGDSAGDSMTTATASPSVSPQPRRVEEKRKPPTNVFTDECNWVDTEAVFAWTITIVNAMTKEKEQISVYNNNTVKEVKESFIQSTGCSAGMRLFQLMGNGCQELECQELEDDWELRHCIRNRSSVLAYAGDLPALLLNTGALGSSQRTTAPQSHPSATIVSRS